MEDGQLAAVPLKYGRGWTEVMNTPLQGGEAFGPIKAIGYWALPHKFPLPAVAEPGGCS